MERRAAELAASPHDKVDFVPQARAAYGATGSAGIGVAVYATRPGSPQYVGETLDVALHHVPLGSSSFRFDTSFSVIRMQTTSPPRFRPGSGTELYLWDAEISRREIDSQTVLAVGRIWPWHTPGLPILDGAQLGRRNEPGTVEGGICGAPSGDADARADLRRLDDRRLRRALATGRARRHDPDGRRGGADRRATFADRGVGS